MIHSKLAVWIKPDSSRFRIWPSINPMQCEPERETNCRFSIRNYQTYMDESGRGRTCFDFSGPKGRRFKSCHLDHNCTAILIQCVSGLRCSSFLSKALCRRGFQALLHESPSLHPARESRKPVPTGVEPSALLHDCFLKGALLHDCSELSCKSGRRIFVMFPSGEGNKKGLKSKGRANWANRLLSIFEFIHGYTKF